MPDIRLVRSLHKDPIYIVVAGVRRHVPDPATFEYLNLRRRDVELLPQGDVDAIELGPPLRSDASKVLLSDRRPRRIARRASRRRAVSNLGATSPSSVILFSLGASLIVSAFAAFWLAPPYLIPSGLGPAEKATAIAAARTSIVQLTAAIIVLAGFYFTFETIRISRVSQLVERDKNDAGRYAEAVKLTSLDNSPDVRVGGILALQSLAKESESEREPVVRFLGSMLPVAANSASDYPRGPLEIRSALDAIRVGRVGVDFSLNLRGLTLEGMDQFELELDGCRLEASRFTGCQFTSSNLAGVTMSESTWTDVDMRNSNFRDVMALGAAVVDCDLSWCDLSNANFLCCDLSGTSFVGSQLGGSIFAGANFRGANLRSVNLASSDLFGADLFGAFADRNTTWPTSVEDPLVRGVLMP